MKFGKEESIQKLDQCQALFQIHLLVTQDFWRRISTRKSVIWSSWLMDLHDFHLPAEERSNSRNDASSRDRGSPHCRRLGEWTLNKPFTLSILCMKCDFLTMAPKKPNQTKHSASRHFLAVVPCSPWDRIVSVNRDPAIFALINDAMKKRRRTGGFTEFLVARQLHLKRAEWMIETRVLTETEKGKEKKRSFLFFVQAPVTRPNVRKPVSLLFLESGVNPWLESTWKNTTFLPVGGKTCSRWEKWLFSIFSRKEGMISPRNSSDVQQHRRRVFLFFADARYRFPRWFMPLFSLSPHPTLEAKKESRDTKIVSPSSSFPPKKNSRKSIPCH